MRPSRNTDKRQNGRHCCLACLSGRTLLPYLPTQRSPSLAAQMLSPAEADGCARHLRQDLVCLVALILPSLQS